MGNKMQKQKYTAVCVERDTGYDDPLVYCIEAQPDVTQEQAFELVLAERLLDLGEEFEGEMRESLEVLFMFPGDLEISHDWRE